MRGGGFPDIDNHAHQMSDNKQQLSIRVGARTRYKSSAVARLARRPIISLACGPGLTFNRFLQCERFPERALS